MKVDETKPRYSKMIQQTVLLALTFLLATSFGGRQNEIYLNYVAAIKNESTFQYYLVVKVKNLNTGLTRAYCTKGNFLKGALHREYKLDYDNTGTSKADSLALGNKHRYFEFKNDSAIRNMSGAYAMEDLAELEKQVNFDALARKIRRAGKWSKEMVDDQGMLMYAHALFNRGILTGENNCAGGTLFYVDRNNTED